MNRIDARYGIPGAENVVLSVAIRTGRRKGIALRQRMAVQAFGVYFRLGVVAAGAINGLEFFRMRHFLDVVVAQRASARPMRRFGKHLLFDMKRARAAVGVRSGKVLLAVAEIAFFVLDRRRLKRHAETRRHGQPLKNPARLPYRNEYVHAVKFYPDLAVGPKKTGLSHGREGPKSHHAFRQRSLHPLCPLRPWEKAAFDGRFQFHEHNANKNKTTIRVYAIEPAPTGASVKTTPFAPAFRGKTRN